MANIVLTIAAFLAAEGTAFAGSDRYGSDNANQPAAIVDTSYTASTQKSDTAVHELVTQGSDRNLFGNR